MFTEEKIQTKVYDTSFEASKDVANEIANIIRQKQTLGQKVVLGLATGNTPIYVYKELIRLHKEEQLSFKNVITFNLDEYYPIKRESLHSYWYFMHSQLFDHIDILPENIHIPDGTINMEQLHEFCDGYEEAILQAGGFDFQLLGIGSTGHIGFNEPGSSINSKTRLITLDRRTRNDASSDFYGIQNTPKYAITMGVGTILKAKRIVIMAFNENKSKIAQRVIEGDISPQYPATYLQQHSNTLFVLDRSAAAGLMRLSAPWLAQGLRGEIDRQYTPELLKKAVIWLSQKVKKPILRLTYEDYEDNSLLDCVTQIGNGNSGAVNLSVFNLLRDIITGWPGGGRPNSSPLTYYEEKKSLTPRKIIVFSPHPDDDVICMGGTLRKLTHQGHEVHVAYQVSGSLAVFDSDAIRFADFISETGKIFNIQPDQCEQLHQEITNLCLKKQAGEVDSDKLTQIKRIIRRTEARQAAQYCGVERKNINFLDLPFYETGKAIKKPLSQEDINIVSKFIQQIQPEQIYAAGDLTDPHGTHRVCLQAILEALKELKNEYWFKNCQFYLYRGAWQEWELEKVSMAVPLSPEELYEKRMAIFKHQSQKDRPMFPGADTREFWQRSEERNKDTARLFTQLGFVNYEALECFVKFNDLGQI